MRIALKSHVFAFAIATIIAILGGCLSGEPASTGGIDAIDGAESEIMVDEGQSTEGLDIATNNGSSQDMGSAVTASGLVNRGDVCFSGACGSATFTWQDRRHIGNISMSVKDNKCDSHEVYIQFAVDDGADHNGVPYWFTPGRHNSNGCHADYAIWNKKHIVNDSDIRAVYVHVCVDAISNICHYSTRIVNPYY